METVTGYNFKCSDIGMQCGFEVHGGSSKDEVLQIAAVHAKASHGMDPIPADVAAKVSAAVRS